ncbi:NADH-quinone oxidoreductase subunit M [Micromonospora sp. 4G57]|uniref:NADH-quinone oxidoreductase subunit M n=1 Tax=Micromonospora sicca TaxID=2202420 RepID=A0ABU5J7F3_9ACTN|nr:MULTISPECIES: NADH-quinone oxidoreductase subunit M [unclassified Micromonospora]MDZ5444726.1 NADH-quinone oxidoreductase subunit M [Micromonospora sp. 4G57]MDZ5488473.1 NADH-quinone oxidoreductase subunit M [Micromonospora sp. 4G53]
MSVGQVLLVAVLAVPALGAVAVAAVPHDRAARLTGVVAAALTLLATVPLVGGDHGWFGYGPRPAVQPWHQLDLPWVPGLDLRFHLGVDGISWPLVVLTALLTLLCCGYTLWRVPDGGSGRALVALLLVVEVGILGTFLALDLVLFFVFFEVVLLPMYAIIAGWGGEDRRRAARKFVLYTLLGSVLLLVGVYVVVAAAGTADLVTLTGGAGLSRGTQLAAFALLALAFAVKSPLWPLHSWLPDAHTQAPTVGSVILAGVLLKMGTYGLIRVAVGVAPEGARWAAPVLGVLAVAAILVGSLVCLAQDELKRLIAYSSVGHMGFVLLGVATLTATGIEAALIGNIAHGVITGLLFFLAGAVKDRTHTGSLAELSGLRETAPRLAGLLGFAAVASLGLPGLAGFWGEAFAVVAAVRRGGGFWVTLAVLAALGGALTAAYFLRLLRQVAHGRPSPAVGRLAPGLAGAELTAWAPLVLLALAVGLAPALVLGYATGPVDALVGVLK